MTDTLDKSYSESARVYEDRLPLVLGKHTELFEKNRWKGKPPTCHEGRKHYAHGMCESCYKGWKRTGRLPEDHTEESKAVPDFVIKHHCIICTDGYSDLVRKCTLHSDICNACHTEYCECIVEGSVTLKPLEEIALLNPDRQTVLLRARKLTLRAAGKKTNSMPLIETGTPGDELVGVTATKYHVERPWRM